jgi:competence protein ComEA
VGGRDPRRGRPGRQVLARSVLGVGETAKWQMVAWAVAAGLLVFAGARLLADRASGPDPPPVRLGGSPEAPRAKAGVASEGREGALYVHVAGAVRRPGLLRVHDGARVAAAIARAGGPARGADLTAVNLAQPLEDGQQVIVPRRGAAARGGPVGPGSGGPARPAGAELPSLGTATVEQLEQLDGIGPALAARIVEYRESHGGFRSIEELREVEGIGEKRFAALKDAVRP